MFIRLLYKIIEIQDFQKKRGERENRNVLEIDFGINGLQDFREKMEFGGEKRASRIFR